MSLNLPGVSAELNDGNLLVVTPNTNPVVLVLGTSTQGDTANVLAVNRLTDASATYGRNGTLVRGLYEVSNGGATNVRLLRVGAKPAILFNFAGKQTFTSVKFSATTGSDYTVAYVKATAHLTITRVADTTVVYDALAAVVNTNLGDFTVVGAALATNDGTADITAGTTLANVPGTDTAASFRKGNDGTTLSRMEMWESLNDAYQLVQDQAFDIVVPMDVYLDDNNLKEITSGTATSLGLTGLTTYPAPAATTDYLGRVFVQEFNGQNWYWWSFTTNGIAQIFPKGVGSASATTDAFGVTLTNGNFHDVNFAYDLAQFCYALSSDSTDIIGMVGVKPPASYSLKDVATWVGTAPVVNTTTNVITTNGTGLLGNRWMAGKLTSGGISGLSINGVDGQSGGGFIATDTGYEDGVQQKDSNGSLIDIGKYLNVCSAQPILSNPVNASYVATVAAAYAGFVASLPVTSAPTNKLMPSVGLPFRIKKSKVDALAGAKYVHLWAAPKGVVVADAPTAARTASDYQRLSTVRIVKAAIDAVREVADPFLGEGLSGAKMAALNTAIDKALNKMQAAQALKRYSAQLSQTPDQAVLGQAALDLTLVPAFELRKIQVHLSLSRA